MGGRCGAELRRLGEGRTDVPPGGSLAGTSSVQARVHGSPGMAAGGQRVPRPARALREREVHGRQEVHLGTGDPVEAERVVGAGVGV
jgi:hypothetical protein